MKLLFSLATVAALGWVVMGFRLPRSSSPRPAPPGAPVVANPLPSGTRPPAASSTEEHSPTTLPADRVVGVAREADRLHAPETTSTEDFLILQNILGAFRRHHAGNPVGDNDDILRALRGKNARGLAYFPPDHPGLDDTGQLLDRWGSPYFFHALSGREMHIRSAGPDRALFTPDDLVHNAP